MGRLLLYGAYGYTGRLVTERVRAKGMDAIVAGRDEGRTRALAARQHLDARAFDLADAAAHFDGVTTVLNLAGPFSKTARPMVDACLARGVNYVDITGEIAVFEALHARGNEAGAAGVVLLPGAGFDVVPSDCLAAHVHRRLPGATELQLAIGGLSDISRGTARTALESIDAGTLARRDHDIVVLAPTPRGTADFGKGLRPTIGMSWGDVATAYYSTGIPDIDVMFEASPEVQRMANLPPVARRFMASRLGQWLGGKAIDRMPAGPGESVRESARGFLIGEARDRDGNVAVAELEPPEAYKLTAMTALEAALRIDRGDVKPGYHTPSTAFGPDFILGFPGVSRRDL